MSVFSCPRCDCPAFTLPADFHDGSEAACAQCRASLGSWAELRQRLEGAAGVTRQPPLRALAPLGGIPLAIRRRAHQPVDVIS